MERVSRSTVSALEQRQRCGTHATLGASRPVTFDMLLSFMGRDVTTLHVVRLQDESLRINEELAGKQDPVEICSARDLEDTQGSPRSGAWRCLLQSFDAIRSTGAGLRLPSHRRFAWSCLRALR